LFGLPENVFRKRFPVAPEHRDHDRTYYGPCASCLDKPPLQACKPNANRRHIAAGPLTATFLYVPGFEQHASISRGVQPSGGSIPPSWWFSAS